MLVYLVTGFFGYIAFYDKDIGGDILLSFNPSFGADLLKFGFVISVALSFPLMVFPCRQSLNTLLFSTTQTLQRHTGFTGTVPMSANKFNGLTGGIILGTLLIGIYFPNVEFVIGLNGSTMGCLISFIFPALMFLKVIPTPSGGQTQAKVVLIVGILTLCLSTYSTIHNASPNEIQDLSDELHTPIILDHDKVKMLVTVPVQRLANKKEKEVVADQQEPPNQGEDKNLVKDTGEEKRQEPPNPQPPEKTGEDGGEKGASQSSSFDNSCYRAKDPLYSYAEGLPNKKGEHAAGTLSKKQNKKKKHIQFLNKLSTARKDADKKHDEDPVRTGDKEPEGHENHPLDSKVEKEEEEQELDLKNVEKRDLSDQQAVQQQGVVPQQVAQGVVPQQVAQGVVPQQVAQGVVPQQVVQGVVPQQGNLQQGVVPQQVVQGVVPQQGNLQQGVVPQQVAQGFVPQQGNLQQRVVPQQVAQGVVPQQGNIQQGVVPQQGNLQQGVVPQQGNLQQGVVPQQVAQGVVPQQVVQGVVSQQGNMQQGFIPQQGNLQQRVVPQQVAQGVAPQQGNLQQGVVPQQVAQGVVSQQGFLQQVGQGGVQQPIANQPVAQQPIANQPVVQQPMANQPVAQQPIAIQPVAQQPIANQPVAQQPIANQPVAQQPIANQPVAQQQMANQPVVQQQIANQPVAQQPIANQPVAQQQIANQPVAQQPIANQPVAQQPIANQAVEQQMVKEPIRQQVESRLVEGEKSLKGDGFIKTQEIKLAQAETAQNQSIQDAKELKDSLKEIIGDEVKGDSTA
ncbi:SLC38A10 [Bugula neritina]|uniref:SLC38A10 n=1 Tax=Bugula neritina TaxID=10212 RepID=A0A7J7JYD0_BUGNE|nr:SLC38A10 [Bugula neritina]